MLAISSVILLLGSGAALAQADQTGSQTTSGASGGTASGAGNLPLGVDISNAGTTAEDHKAFFRARNEVQRQQILDHCKALMSDASATGTGAGSSETTDETGATARSGSVANSDSVTAGTTAASSSGSLTTSRVATFCQDVQR